MPDFDKQHAKYQRDQELLFKIQNRRNKLLGLWLAKQMNLADDEREAYARTVVAADFEKPGDDDVLDKVMADIGARGLSLSRSEIRQQMDELMVTARHQIEDEAEKVREA